MLGVRRVGILGHHDVGIILGFHLESDVGTVSSRVKGVIELCILSVHSCWANIGYRFVVSNQKSVNIEASSRIHI